MKRPINPSLQQKTIVNGLNDSYYAYNPTPGLSIKTMSNGHALYEIEGGRFVVSDETYLILNQEQPYTIEIESPTTVESFCIFFPEKWAEDVFHSSVMPHERLLDNSHPNNTLHFMERSYRHDDLVSPQIAQIQTMIKQQSMDSGVLEERLRFLLVNMLQMQFNIYREVATMPAARLATRIELYRRLHQARDFMEASLSEPITLEIIAAVVHLSPYHFLRAFKQLFGQTPHAYLTQKRLERARFLLLRTERPVIDICLEVGFESPGSFSTLFQRHHGLSPRAYRNAQF